MSTIISFPPKLKAMSVHAPHAYAICMGKKDIEYRSKPTNRRHWILIHASQSKDSDDCFNEYGINPKNCKRGAIIGACKITECIKNSEWDFEYYLDEPLLFKNPIEGVRGAQSIFWGATTHEREIAFTLASQQIREFLLKI